MKRLLSIILCLATVLTMFGFTVTAADAADFTDVHESDWFYDEVQYVAEKELFKGTAADTFSPNESMTRAMIVTVLYRLAGTPETESTT